MKYDSRKRWITIERKKENGKYSKELDWTTDCLLRNRKAIIKNENLRVTDTTFEFSADLLDVLIKFTCEHDDKTFDKRFFIFYLLLFQMNRDNLLQILDEDIMFFEELKKTYDLLVQDTSLQFSLPPVEYDPTKLQESFQRIVTDLIMNILGPYLDRGEKFNSLIEKSALDIAPSNLTIKKQENDAQHTYSTQRLEQMKTFGPAMNKWLALYAKHDLNVSKQINYKNDSQSNNTEKATHCGFWAVAVRCAQVLCMPICGSLCANKQADESDEAMPLTFNRIKK